MQAPHARPEKEAFINRQAPLDRAAKKLAGVKTRQKVACSLIFLPCFAGSAAKNCAGQCARSSMAGKKAAA